MPTQYQEWRNVPDVGKVRDVDSQIFAILMQYPTLAFISQEQDIANQHKHEWLEYKRSPIVTTLTANISSHAASASGISITVVDGSIFRVGDLVNVDNLAPTYQITSIATNTLTVTEVRGVALGSAAGNGNTIRYTRGYAEGSSYSNDFKGAELPTQEYNFTQIFRRDIQVTASMLQSSRAGGLYGLGSAWDNAATAAMQDVVREMNEAAINGVRIERTSGVQRGYMGGIRQFVDKPAGNVVTASGALTLTHLNNLSALIYDDMGNEANNLKLFCNPYQARVMATFTQNVTASAVINDPGAGRSIGDNVARFVPNTSGMAPMEIVLDQTWPRDVVAMLDVRFIKWIQMVNRAMLMVNATTPGYDGQQGYIRGEYSLIVRDALYRHGIIKGLT